MSCEDLANLIIEKLRTGRVKFFQFRIDNPMVAFRYGGIVYFAEYVPELREILVLVDGVKQDNYSRWVEGVLNGKKRDAAGVLS